jgi:hypothetical protein
VRRERHLRACAEGRATARSMARAASACKAGLKPYAGQPQGPQSRGSGGSSACSSGTVSTRRRRNAGTEAAQANEAEGHRPPSAAASHGLAGGAADSAAGGGGRAAAMHNAAALCYKTTELRLRGPEAPLALRGPLAPPFRGDTSKTEGNFRGDTSSTGHMLQQLRRSLVQEAVQEPGSSRS